MAALRLYFEANVNNFDGSCHIDYAIFTDPEGNEVCLDGDKSGGCEDGVMDMEWRECYDIEDENNSLIYDEGYMTMLSFKEFVFEAETPTDYSAVCFDWGYKCL